MTLKELVELAIERGWDYSEFFKEDYTVSNILLHTRDFTFNKPTVTIREESAMQLHVEQLILTPGFMTALFGHRCIHQAPTKKNVCLEHLRACNEMYNTDALCYFSTYLYHSQKAASLVIQEGAEKAIEYLGEVCGE
jgi:hypothetical protein